MAEAKFDQQVETETLPAMEVHVGEVFVSEMPREAQSDDQGRNAHTRHCIIWLNGKRWEGRLYDNTTRDTDNLPDGHH
jgi:hypothetical protein